MKKTLILSAVIAISDDGDEGDLSDLSNSAHRIDKKAAVRRVRVTFSEVTNLLTCTKLKLRFRMTRPTFTKLLPT